MQSFKHISTTAEAQIVGIFSPTADLIAQLPSVPEGSDYLVFCDGACHGNGAKPISPGGWGAAVITKERQGAMLGRGSSANSTNNKMELTAAIEALKQTAVGSKVLLRTDSQYCIKGCTEWRAGWIRNGMKNSKKEPVANADLWRAMWPEVDKRTVAFQWVKGHSGHPGNELVDQLATMACYEQA